MIFYSIKTSDKIYKDVKADYRGPLKGHITIKPFLFTDRRLANQHMNDYISQLRSKIMLNTKQFNKDIDTLEEIKNKAFKGKLTIKEHEKI